MTGIPLFLRVDVFPVRAAVTNAVSWGFTIWNLSFRVLGVEKSEFMVPVDRSQDLVYSSWWYLALSGRSEIALGPILYGH